MSSHATSPPQYTRREEFLHHVPLFGGLSAAEYTQLAAILREQRYRKNEVVFHANDPGSALFLLKKGVVKVAVEALDRRELIVRFLYPPDFFGEMALLDNLPRSATITALEPSEALLLERGDFIQLVERTPTLLPKIAEALSRRLRKANELVHNLAFLDAYAKVARVLLDLAQERGQPAPDGCAMHVRISQRELAELTGMARGTVARVLSDFRQAGYIHVAGGNITILEPAILAHKTVQP